MQKHHPDDPPSEPNEALIEDLQEEGVPESERMPNAGGTMAEGNPHKPEDDGQD